RTSGGDLANGDSGGITADYGVWFANGLDALHQRLLWSQLLDNDLDDPVTLRQLVEIVLKVAECYEIATISASQIGRTGLGHAIIKRVNDPVARRGIGFFGVAKIRGDNVKQDDRDADVGQMGCYAAPHRPGSDNAHLINSIGHIRAPV